MKDKQMPLSSALIMPVIVPEHFGDKSEDCFGISLAVSSMAHI